MKKSLIFSTIVLFFMCGNLVAAQPKSHHLYIISTNDMHANIDMMPRLATLVKEYEARGEVLLVDSGDRVTGNAYVDDDSRPGIPMMELMNVIGYDVVTLGNHEFDKGREVLNSVIKASDFDWVCSNVEVLRGMKPIKPYKIVRYKGAKIGFVGVVCTGANGRPTGAESSYKDFRFTEDYTTAYRVCERIDDRCDFVVLLSHMGFDMDQRFAELDPECDWVAGGHSHDVVNATMDEVHISQNRKDIRYVTVADLEIYRGDVERVTYTQIDVREVDADQSVAALVDQIKMRDPDLNTVETRALAPATQDGVANFTTKALATYPYDNGFVPEVSFYHFGGVRLSGMEEGDVKRVAILNNDPFVSTIYLGEMSVEQMREFILDKYNSGTSAKPDKESHYPYFRSDVPYTLVLANPEARYSDAVDVIFPTLDEGRMYRVSMCNYIAENYIDKTIVATQLYKIDTTVRDAMLRLARSYGQEGFTPDNRVYQTEKR